MAGQPSAAPVSKASRRRRLKEYPARTRFLDYDEEIAFLAAANPDLAGQIAFDIDTGLRKEELWSLTWPQIQGGHKEVFIPATQARSGRQRRRAFLTACTQIGITT